MSNKWIKTEDAVGAMFTLGFNPTWICDDYCPDGIRPLSYNGDKWLSWVWCNHQDYFYEGDDTQPTLLRVPRVPDAAPQDKNCDVIGGLQFMIDQGAGANEPLLQQAIDELKSRAAGD